jgi:hypothetical protein
MHTLWQLEDAGTRVANLLQYSCTCSFAILLDIYPLQTVCSGTAAPTLSLTALAGSLCG